MRDICFWDSMESPHKYYWMNEVAKINKNFITECYVESELSDSRKKLGWSVPEEVLFCANKNFNYNDVDNVVKSKRSFLHIISGIRHTPLIKATIKACIKYKVDYWIISEPRVYEGFSGKIRFIQSYLTERKIIKSCQAVLAIGRHGQKWFDRVGYRDIFQFAYFVPAIEGIKNFDTKKHTVGIGYLGRLESSKGFDRVVEIYKNNTHGLPNLYVAGDGSLKNNIVSLAACNNNIEYSGVLPIAQVNSFFSKIDYLIVPSRTTDDGWGVVVSEALMCGIKVIVSRNVGASICVDSEKIGFLIDGKDDKNLKEIVIKLQADYNKSALANLAKKCLNDSYGAEYFMDLVRYKYFDGVKPVARWTTISSGNF